MPAEHRPDISIALKREVLVEAGHRCAIPTCRQIPVEIAHIVPWKTVKDHTFENLIALCPTCHTRYDAKQIDRPSMRQYKANLSVLNSRYGDLERRVLLHFAEDSARQSIYLPGGLALLLMYLIRDRLLEKRPNLSLAIGGGAFLATEQYVLTEAGREFVKRWLAAQPVDRDSALGNGP
jgi:HNH endonuclease